MDGRPQGTSAPPGLGALIRARREDILERWQERVRLSVPVAGISRERLRDHLPRLLDGIAEAIDSAHQTIEDVREFPQVHAIERLDAGFDLGTVIAEYAELRSVVLDVYAEACGPQISVSELKCLEKALDAAVRASVERYTVARERALVGLDRLSQAAQESGDLDRFLPKLLELLLETTASIDSIAILLLDEKTSTLRTRAAVGLEEEVRQGFSVRVGEGFAGHVAAAGEPLESHDAMHDPRVISPAIRTRRTRALYGVPMTESGRLIGVAHMGSRTAPAFSAEDKLLFRAMVARASTLLHDAALVQREREALHQSKRVLSLLDALLTTAPVGIALLDKEFRYVRINPALAASNGFPVEHHLGRRVEEILAPRQVEAIVPILRQVMETGKTVVHREITLPGRIETDPVVIALGAVFPVREETGEIEGVGVVLLDITHHKRAEEELRRAAQFRESFLWIVSHDLRNPLNAINATAAWLLKDASIDPKHVRSLLRIKDSAERMGRMIRDLLDFTRGRLGGGMPIELQLVDLRSVIRGVVEELEASQPDRNIEVSCEGNLYVEADPDRVAQALGNLVKNALDYSTEREPVRVSVSDEGERVRFEIWNSGDPIPADVLPNLFEPFAAPRRVRTGGGLGLGLYIVQQVVDAHRGTISVSSNEKEGTTFTVLLPRRRG